MKTLWLHHESGCGGRLDEEPGNDDFFGDAAANLVEYWVSMKIYVYWYQQGYDLDWVPPEWVLDLFD